MRTLNFAGMDRRGSEPYVEQNYVVHDQTYGLELLGKLNKCRSDSSFTDAILCVGHEEFPCHRNVLAVSSPYFMAMFSNDLRERNEGRISFDAVSPWTMRRIIDYAYTGRIEITVDNAQELLAAGSLFQYPTIVEACCDFLAKHLHPSNCFGIENYAQMYSCSELYEKARRFALDNFSVVVDYDEFLELPLDRLISYLSSDLIDVSKEEIVYDSALKWVKYDLDNRKHCLGDVLNHVRLATVDVHYLEDVVAVEPLVNNFERCRIIVDDAKRYHETLTNQLGQRRRSMQPDTVIPRPSTVAKDVIVMVGGINGVSYILQAVEMYEPHKNKWSPLPEMPEMASWFSVAALQNDIYVCGGILDGHIISNVYKFESLKRRWVEVQPMRTPRARHSSTSLNNKLYVFGGINLDEGKIVAVEAIECYDLDTRMWTQVGVSQFPRKQARVVAFNQMLVEIGGTQGDAKVQTMESYVCEGNGYEVSSSGEQFVLPDAIQFSQVVVLHGIFYIIWEDTRKVIALNPEKRTFRRLADMKHVHLHSGATVLNEKIYVCGGLADSKTINTIECYDPATDVWTVVKSMKQSRACHGCVTIQMS